MVKKSKKYSDINKHRDKQTIDQFYCKSCIKIIIYKDSIFSNIEIYHILHLIWPDTSISSKVKKFILDNIDLLLWEIYKRLVEHGLNINIY